MDAEKLREAFAKFDSDGSGLIDSAELKAALRAAYDHCGEEISEDTTNQMAEVSKPIFLFTFVRYIAGVEFKSTSWQFNILLETPNKTNDIADKALQTSHTHVLSCMLIQSEQLQCVPPRC